MANPRTTRRNFLLTSMIAASGVIGHAAYQQTRSEANARTTPEAPASASPTNASAAPASVSTTHLAEMPQQILGRTGIAVPILGLGGAGQTPLSREGQEREAIAQIERALELGIRYFDTAASYGPSEANLGKVLPPHRANLFLASKTRSRERDGAWRDLEQSLQRLQTNHLDLWQFHSLSREADLDSLLDEQRGAIRAAEEAQQQGLIRFVGITGHHDPDIIAEGLRRYPFHTALIPINAADQHTEKPFIGGVLPTARQNNVGIIAMKVPAYGRLIETGTVEGMRQAMGYALSQPGVNACIIAAETLEQLEHNVTVARAFQPLAAEELSAIEQRTAADWQSFNFFRDWM